MVTKKKQYEKPSMITRAYTTASSSCRQLSFRGAWRRLSLTLLVALCCHTAASAKTLTVYDGTDDSQYLPVYGYYADVAGTKTEFVIPKGELSEMEDGTISALTFYLKTNIATAWTAKFQVYLKEIDATTLPGITGHEDNDVVYTGNLDATGTVMTVTFDKTYTYKGGNLLIGTYISVKGSNYPQAFFYGVKQDVNTGYYNSQPAKFIPKTTFTYTPSSSVVSKPKNLAASNITHEKATITWISDESAWDIAWSTDPDFNPASATTRADNVSEKTYTITGLSQLTDYYVAVQNAGSGKWSSTLHFKTAAIATAVGNSWSENFESPGGWDLINGELTNQWTWGTAANNGGTHALYISNDGGTTNAYTFITSNTIVYATRLLTFTEGTFEFSYDWRAYGENNSDYLRVALKPATESLTAGTTAPTGLNATSLPTGWIALDGGSQLSGVTAWQHKDATIDVAAGDYYLVFAWRNDGGAGNNPPAAIDNVSISKYTDKVTDLAVSNITTTAATISWNGNGDSYNVRYTKLFLTEGFEGGSMPAGWTKEGTGLFSIGTGDNETDRGSHSGNKNARFPSSSSNIGNQTYLITPSMDLSGETSLKLSFWYINRAAVSHIDGIGVYYRVGTEGEWNELWSTTEAHGSWTNQEVTLTGLAANYQLGFKMTNNDGYGVGLDDIQITPADWQTVNDITTKSTTLTGLDANTTYGCQVQNVKGGNTSLWSPIATFTTAAAAIVLTDGEDLSALSAYAGQKVVVTYLRSFTSGKASTVCVPFAFDVTSASGTFYTFTGITKSGSTYIANMTASVSTTLTPNTPYVFMPSATGDVDFSGTYTLPASLTASSATSGDWKFYGTYTRLSYGTAPMTGYVYGFASVDATVEGHEVTAGEFVRATTGAGVPPMRCYLIYKDGEAYTNARALTRGEEMPQSIIVRLLDANGQTTSIGSLDMKTGEMEFDGWYSLDGSRLEGKPTKKGLYINNGKKVIIK